MKFPNKAIRYNESIVSRFVPILQCLEEKEYSVSALYDIVKNQMEDIIDFMDALDCLFALGFIKFNSSTRRLYYVIPNSKR